MKVIDLFCGAGGFSEGFKQASFEIILGVDIWGVALESFKANHNCEVWEADIRTIDNLPDCDVIIGSPPCQEFSSLNRNRDLLGGMELVKEFERIIEINKPTFWVWENVVNVKKIYPQAFILDAWSFGLPQRRKRAFIANFSFLRRNYLEGVLTPPYGYDGHRTDNTGACAKKHTHQSGAVRTKRIRNHETGEYLSMDEVKKLMGFPPEYFLSGGVNLQQKQLGNAVCPPVAKVIAEAILEVI